MLESRNFYLNENKNSISKTKKNTQIKSINRSGSQLDLTSKLSSSNPKQNNNRELNNLKKNKSSVFSSSDNNKYDILLNSKYKLKTNSVFSFIEKTIIKYKTVKDNLNKMIIDEIPSTTESLKLKNLQLVEELKKFNEILTSLVENTRFYKNKNSIIYFERNKNINMKSSYSQELSPKLKTSAIEINKKLLQSYIKQYTALYNKYKKITSDDYVKNLKAEKDEIIKKISELEKKNRQLQTLQNKSEYFFKNKSKINENEIEYKKNLEQYENYSNDLQKIMTDIEKKNNIIKTNELQISKLEENHQNLLKIADAYNIINPDKQIKQKKTDKNKKDIFEETKKNLKKEKLEYKTTINKMIVRQKQNNKLIKELEEDFFNFKETLQEKKKALFFWKDKLYEIENELKNQSYLIKENENSIKSFADKINDDIKNNSKVNENTPKKNNINKIKPLNKKLSLPVIKSINVENNTKNNNIDFDHIKTPPKKFFTLKLTNKDNYPKKNNIIKNNYNEEEKSKHINSSNANISLESSNNKLNNISNNLNYSNISNNLNISNPNDKCKTNIKQKTNNNTYNKQMIIKQLDSQEKDLDRYNKSPQNELNKSINVRKNLKPNFSFSIGTIKKDKIKNNSKTNLSVIVQPKRKDSKNSKNIDEEIKEDISINVNSYSNNQLEHKIEFDKNKDIEKVEGSLIYTEDNLCNIDGKNNNNKKNNVGKINNDEDISKNNENREKREKLLNTVLLNNLNNEEEKSINKKNDMDLNDKKNNEVEDNRYINNANHQENIYENNIEYDELDIID